jgi:uncharacterized protein YacL
MKKYISHLLFLLIGLLIGLVIMGVLSMKASHTFVEIIRSQYLQEQQMMAAQARKDGKLHWELVYRKNVVDVSSHNTLSSFEEAGSNWSLIFPLAAPILNEISNIPNKDDTLRRIHGINLARMADTLELLGKKKEAARLWQQAAEQMGYDDIEKARSRVTNFTEIDSGLLETGINLNKTTDLDE